MIIREGRSPTKILSRPTIAVTWFFASIAPEWAMALYSSPYFR